MRKSAFIKTAIVVISVVFFVSCVGLQTGENDLDALADAAGFALGAYCHDHPDAAATVESLYFLATEGIATPLEAINAGADYLLKTDSFETKLIVHEVFALIKAAGGGVLDKKIVELGEADKALFATAKAAYIEALKGVDTAWQEKTNESMGP